VSHFDDFAKGENLLQLLLKPLGVVAALNKSAGIRLLRLVFRSQNAHRFAKSRSASATTRSVTINNRLKFGMSDVHELRKQTASTACLPVI